MGIDTTREERQHQRVAELLPWYVNGSLAAEERRTVEEHALTCPRCRRDLAGETELARAIREAGSAAPSPHPVQLSRLLSRIDACEAEQKTAGHAARAAGAGRVLARPVAGFAGLLDRTPKRVRQLMVAQLAAVLALAALLGWHLREPHLRQTAPLAAPAVFHTLSSDAPVPAVPGTVPLRVLFTEETKASRIQQILAGIHGQITAGPSSVGAYVVAVPVGPGADPVDLVLAHLKAQPEVSFAARVAG